MVKRGTQVCLFCPQPLDLVGGLVSYCPRRDVAMRTFVFGPTKVCGDVAQPLYDRCRCEQMRTMTACAVFVQPLDLE